MDFALLSPEVNSGLMYSGPGAGPMLAAAAGWDAVAASLESAASGYSSEVAGLTGHAWSGPSSMMMTAAVMPYVAWLQASSAQAGQTAAQAYGAAAAYEAAFAATVPPPVIAANRAQLAVLVATNFFGQNTPAIAATEAQYAVMWAQDATAMYGYAAASQTASTLKAFSQPPQTTNPAGQADQARAVTQAAGNTTAARTQSVVQMASTNATQQATAQQAGATAHTASSVGTVSSVEPGQTVTASAGTTITVGPNTQMLVPSGSVTTTTPGVWASSSTSLILEPGTSVTVQWPAVLASNGQLLNVGTTYTAPATGATLLPYSAGGWSTTGVTLAQGAVTVTGNSYNLTYIATATSSSASAATVTVGSAGATITNSSGTVAIATVAPATVAPSASGLGAASSMASAPGLAGTAGIEPQFNAEGLAEWAQSLAGVSGGELDAGLVAAPVLG